MNHNLICSPLHFLASFFIHIGNSTCQLQQNEMAIDMSIPSTNCIITKQINENSESAEINVNKPFF